MRALLLLLFLVPQGKDEIIAIVGARIITATKGDIARGVIIIKNGKIAEVAADAKVPDGATVIDGKGLVAMPGLVNPYCRIVGGSGGGAMGSNALVMAYDELNPAMEVFRLIPRTGFTTLAIYPTQGATSGQAVAIKPVGRSRDSMVIEKTAYLRFMMDLNTATKQQLKTDFETGKKTAAPKPPEKDQPAPPPKAEEILGRFMRGEMRGIVETHGAAEIAHFYQVWKAHEETKAGVALTVFVDAWKAQALLAEKKATVILRPDLTFQPFTRNRINPAAELSKAGVTIVLLPSSDSLAAHEQFLFKVAELVKTGLDRDVALKAITINAAVVAGLDKRIGSIEAGKDADVLLYEGDPLEATSRLRMTMINGKVVFDGRQP